jgi:hypothetical protein
VIVVKKSSITGMGLLKLNNFYRIRIRYFVLRINFTQSTVKFPFTPKEEYAPAAVLKMES